MFSRRRSEYAPLNRHPSFSFADWKVLAGLGLVAASIAIGVVLFRDDDTSVVAWQASRDMPAGVTVTSMDFEPVRVDLGEVGGGYATEPATGVLKRPMLAGELLPDEAIGDAIEVEHRMLTLPVEPLHAPDISAGDLIDVWTTNQETGETALAISDVYVVSVMEDMIGAGGESGIVVTVPVTQIDTMVAALRSGVVDVVRVPAV